MKDSESSDELLQLSQVLMLLRYRKPEFFPQLFRLHHTSLPVVQKAQTHGEKVKTESEGQQSPSNVSNSQHEAEGPKETWAIWWLGIQCMPTHFGESKHYLKWFATEVTGDKLLPVMGPWLHWPGGFTGFDALLWIHLCGNATTNSIRMASTHCSWLHVS